MAEQKGLIKLTGTIGEFNFYFRKGKPVARKAGGGFTTEKVKHSPAMVRTRENSKEFGHVSKFKRLFRMGLFPFLNGFADSSLHGRLMSLLQTVKIFDTVSARGERTLGIALATPEGKRLLEQFAFTEKRLGQVLPGKVVFDPNTATLSVSDFKIAQLVFPHQATIAEVQFGVLHFDTNAMETELFMSPAVTLPKNTTIANFSLTPTAPVEGNGVFIAVVSVRFYEEVNGERYFLKDLGSQCVEVVGVW